MTGKPNFTQKGPPIDFVHEQIRLYLQKLHFRPRLFGVDQQDVWRKLEKLNAMYENALLAERARYDALLAVKSAKYKVQPGEEGSEHEETEKRDSGAAGISSQKSIAAQGLDQPAGQNPAGRGSGMASAGPGISTDPGQRKQHVSRSGGRRPAAGIPPDTAVFQK